MLRLSSVFTACAVLVGCNGSLFSSDGLANKKSSSSADSAASQGNGSSGGNQSGSTGNGGGASKGSGTVGIDPMTVGEIDPRVAASVVNSGVLAVQRAVEVTFNLSFYTQNQDIVEIVGLFNYGKPNFGQGYKHYKELKAQVEVGREYEVVFPSFPTTTRIQQNALNILNMENNPAEAFGEADFESVQVIASKGRFLGVDPSWQYQQYGAPNKCKFVVLPEDLTR